MSARAGYSLFEVLVAFAVMTAVLAVLLPGQSRLLGRAAGSEDRVLAKDVALSELDRIGLDLPLEPGEESRAYRNWTVTHRLSPLPPPDEGLMILIEITDASDRLLAQVTATRITE